MSAEHVLELFDSFWFHSAIFGDKPASPPAPPPPSSSSATRSSHEGRDGVDDDDRLLLETKLSRAPTLHVRSRSDQFSGGLFLGSDPFSPNSVLLAATPKLRTILSGKEVSDFEGEQTTTTRSEGETEESPSRNRGNKKSENTRRKKKKKERSQSSKSLSELEFQELKGFMDLGFVFSDQDRDDSNLVSILPGLQRLGLSDAIEAQEKDADEIEVPRPYLSEAWDSLDRQRKRYEDPLVNWRVPAPALGNEMAMKDHLRSWAHTVASTVR
ncbi:uncharacterized protein LOC115746823 [Rhodamnia argentea]|uniref:Uncharacterized protein LOC115746823 n=1 Tax=Rhodamnia argentea TaxID=178133 RepID=A0A8B8PV01_9MYRT|nr:uncharacterized protein LOC115746823 [Rhodamnia argentea]XP_048138084.1 uncharacterized protein LOC115746823 [Rhodamnia argentea]XP_048138085.1 uncharacterized protein LOC115746823 [Rhodamnia argentea]XP_048138086.1 uncharacterized protein LOC115746823 [Rhodamnia argentea]